MRALADGLYHPGDYEEGPAFGIRIVPLIFLQNLISPFIITIVHTETLKLRVIPYLV